MEREAEQVRTHLRSLIRTLGFLERSCGAGQELSLAQCHALGELARHGPLSLNALADRLYLSPSAASRAVDALVRRGLVRRTPDPADRRYVVLAPSRRGEAVLADLDASLNRRVAGVLERLGPAGARRFAEALGALAAELEDAARKLAVP